MRFDVIARLRVLVRGVNLKLMLATEWSAKYFAEGSQPSEVTLARWMRDGKVPARKVGGKWYVDEDAWLAGDDPLVLHVLGVS